MVPPIPPAPPMKDSLRQQFERLVMRLAELDASLSDPATGADMKRYRALAREQAEASGLVTLFRRYQQREADLASAKLMLTDDSDADMMAMAREEAAAAAADECPTAPQSRAKGGRLAR